MRFLKKIILGLAAIVFVSCSVYNTQLSSKGKLLSFPAAFYDRIALINDRLTAFAYDPDKIPSDRVSYAYEGDTNLIKFNPGLDNNCEYTMYQVEGKLPDGRLGLLKDCFERSLNHSRTIYAYDWQTAELARLVNGPLAENALPMHFTWDPKMARGIQEMNDSGASGTIYWLSPQGISPMDVEIEDRGLKWNLKDLFDGKTNTGIVRAPAWSPDGKTISFFASVYGINEQPIPKQNINYDLYIMDPAELKPSLTLSAIINAQELQWSPDSRRVLFYGCTGSSQQCGIWVYDITTKSLNYVANGDYEDYMWMSNSEVVAIKLVNGFLQNDQIWQYSLGQYLTK